MASSPSRHTRSRPISAYGYEQAKALVYQEHGDPDDVLSLHTHSISPPHSDLATLRMLASPINPADINTIQGTYPTKPAFTTSLSTPHPIAVPGNEGVAEVISAGAAAKTISSSSFPDPPEPSQEPEYDTPLKKGDWVIMRASGVGTWRTHLQAPASSFLHLATPDREDITPLQAATVSVNPCTAWAMLRGWTGAGTSPPDPNRSLKEGDWFVQNGANSGVGRAAIQLGRAWGLRSVNVIRTRPGDSEEDASRNTQALKDELHALGADVVVTEEEAAEKGFGAKLASEHIKPSSGSDSPGVRLALNCVGGRSALSLAKLLTSTDPPTSHVTYGAMAKQPLSVPAGLLIFWDTNFTGFWVSAWAGSRPGEKMKAVKEVLGLMKAGKFKQPRFDAVEWGWMTDEQTLKKAVSGALEGFRGAGKGVFVFGET